MLEKKILMDRFPELIQELKIRSFSMSENFWKKGERENIFTLYKNGKRH